MRGFRSTRFAVVCAAIVVTLTHVDAQTPVPAASLQAGIAHVNARNFASAITAFDEVVMWASLEQSGLVARAQLYKAEAYFGMNQPEHARTSAILALNADPGISINTLGVSSALTALIGELRAASAADPETAGRSAETSGHYQDAFVAYLRAFRSLPEPAPPADSQRLRERLITVVRRLDPKPVIPQDAKVHFGKAEELLQAERLLGSAGTGPSEAAAAELRLAIKSAPWWSDATFNLAEVLQKLQRFDEALVNLNLYRLADPNGYAAIAVKKPAPAPVSTALVPPALVATPASVATTRATLYIYWPPQARGKGRPEVRCDGHHVADLQSRRFIVLNVAPGTRNIGFHNKTFPFSFQTGATYYLRASAEGFPTKAIVRLVTAGEGTTEMREEGVTSNDPRRTYSAECSAGVVGRKR